MLLCSNPVYGVCQNSWCYILDLFLFLFLFLHSGSGSGSGSGICECFPFNHRNRMYW